MIDYSNIIYGVLGYLGKAIIVIGAFHVGRNICTKIKWGNYLNVLGTAAFLSFIICSSYGTHTEDADPLYGGGETVVDFEPTDSQRNEYGLTLFLSLSIPALYGVYKKHEEL